MKVILNETHRARLASIVSEATKLLEAGQADTGPGGEDAKALEKSLGDMDEALDYYLGES